MLNIFSAVPEEKEQIWSVVAVKMCKGSVLAIMPVVVAAMAMVFALCRTPPSLQLLPPLQLRQIRRRVISVFLKSGQQNRHERPSNRWILA